MAAGRQGAGPRPLPPAFTAHSERTALEFEVFEATYAAADPGSPELDGLVAAAVPDPADRLDLEALDRPLYGVTYESAEALQDGLRAHITADLARRRDPDHSTDLAVFVGLLSACAQLVRLGDIGGWWHGFFSYLASGPPGSRLEQLLAPSRAGTVRFLGASVTVTADEERGLFRASSVNATFNEPYELARRLATLDHLSEGRAAWNVVTSSDAFTGENFRRGGYLDRTDRFTRAAEFVATARELWDSWTPDGASRPFAHEGEQFTISGEFTCPTPRRATRWSSRPGTPARAGSSPPPLPTSSSPGTAPCRRAAPSTPT